jgi:hypothetical protein
MTRSHDSLGDCAPGSIRSNAWRARAMPLRPVYLRASASTSVASILITLASASMPATAVVTGYQQPRSSAVLAAEVTGMPATKSTSPLSVPVRLDTPRAAQIVVNQIHHLHIVDPPAAVYSSGGETCDDTLASSPEPRRFGTKLCIDGDTMLQIHVGEKSAASRRQLRFSPRPRSDFLASDEWIWHDSSVAFRTPSSTSAIHTSSRECACPHRRVRECGWPHFWRGKRR